MFDASYSPDGKAVLYIAVPPASHHYAIYEVDLDGTGLREVTSATSSAGVYSGGAGAPEYSPDGKTILFVAGTRTSSN
jgi:Tol biopolymer transport system component